MRGSRSANACARLPAPIEAEALAVPSHHRVGLNDRHGPKYRRTQPIEPNQDQPIDDRQPHPRGHPATQDVHLVPENHDLGFKSPFGPEQRPYEPRNDLQNLDHLVSDYPIRGLTLTG